MRTAQFSALSKSVDELAETSGFELDFCQLEAGEPTIKSTTTILSSVISTEFDINKSFHQRGAPPDGYLSFGFMQGKSQSRWAGKDVGSDHLIDFNGRCGFETISGRAFSAKGLHVKESRLHEIADVLGVDLSSLGAMDYALPKRIDPIRLNQLHVAIQNAEHLVQALQHQPPGSVDIVAVEENIYRKLTHCLDISQRKNSTPCSNRLASMRRAIDFIQSHSREVCTITDVCRASATTSRTLERVFREELGVTPKKYMKLVKLMGVRRDISQHNQEENIRDIALSWGFWHMSQFAQDYKIHFGELPSQTQN